MLDCRLDLSNQFTVLPFLENRARSIKHTSRSPASPLSHRCTRARFEEGDDELWTLNEEPPATSPFSIPPPASPARTPTPTRRNSASQIGWDRDSQIGVPASPSAHKNASSLQMWPRGAGNSGHGSQQHQLYHHPPVPRTPSKRSQHHQQLGRLGGVVVPVPGGGLVRRSEPDVVATMESEIRYLTPPLLLLLRGLLHMERSAFAREAGWVYPALADLVVVRNLEVRATVRELLCSRVAHLLTVPVDTGIVAGKDDDSTKMAVPISAPLRRDDDGSEAAGHTE